MNKNQKKALYESIMRQVAKTVKKALNESVELQQKDIDALISLCHELFYDDKFGDLYKTMRLVNRDKRRIEDTDTDEMLLAWYYGETSIDYQAFFKYLLLNYDHSRDSQYYEQIYGDFHNIFAELRNYPNTEYKEDLERCVRVGLQSALEDKGLI